ncbi:MAG: hypothetical protein P4L28_11015 [Paludibacteraceae bacterium]|nr:hypothetical protein [Paludibacteraceae bacterium]
MSQKIENINLTDLVLWTENPRDPIDENASDQDVVDRAILDKKTKWTLQKLAKEMGEFYDFSELPTVVYHGNKPIVYDGNRRIILGKIKHNLVSLNNQKMIDIPDIPNTIPCNVCSKDVALKNVYRKHADSGSWDPLERDIFLHKFMGEKKSNFLLFEENTGGFISSNTSMNQRFVKEEILNEKNLETLGFSFKDGELLSKHSNKEILIILKDLTEKIENKTLSTRNNRGEVINSLDTRVRNLIDSKNNNAYTKVNISENKFEAENDGSKQVRKTRRIDNSNKIAFFGNDLYLKAGDVNNLYRDISALNAYYCSNKSSLSNSFPAIIRMSLRLLSESAAKDNNLGLSQYIAKNFEAAKKNLSQEEKTLLSVINVNEKSLIQLLNTGAHDYAAGKIYEQTIAISLILGAILSITHKKND